MKWIELTGLIKVFLACCKQTTSTTGFFLKFHPVLLNFEMA